MPRCFKLNEHALLAQPFIPATRRPTAMRARGPDLLSSVLQLQCPVVRRRSRTWPQPRANLCCAGLSSPCHRVSHTRLDNPLAARPASAPRRGRTRPVANAMPPCVPALALALPLTKRCLRFALSGAPRPGYRATSSYPHAPDTAAWPCACALQSHSRTWPPGQPRAHSKRCSKPRPGCVSSENRTRRPVAPVYVYVSRVLQVRRSVMPQPTHASILYSLSSFLPPARPSCTCLPLCCFLHLPVC
ncbi:hypothetical protein B0H15DRAFT_810268 [Mycena belliarum]|uniref:Uncharacterized protein n=1 Tax=Mycena belliarum TaxID=1033014 RepID=A0AAD6XYI8_9AGAR|nr:hypothetical protein B0H15DRAFT_810268 [Mycena belliae]